MSEVNLSHMQQRRSMPPRGKPSCRLCEGLWVKAQEEMPRGRSDGARKQTQVEQLEMAAAFISLFILCFFFLNALKVTMG